jgi:hypothetical protein
MAMREYVLGVDSGARCNRERIAWSGVLKPRHFLLSENRDGMTRVAFVLCGI